MARFTDKTVIVTGAGSGIGAAAARLFSAGGANVIAFGRDLEKMNASIDGLPEDRTIVVVGDTSKASDADAAVAAAVERFGGLDILVNNAGVVVQGDVGATSEEDWTRVLTINATGYFLMAKAAIPELKKTKGSIVQTSSVSGLGGDWGMAAYDASKGAVTNLTRAMALDLGKDGVRVNAVAPSLTRTGMTKDMADATIAKFMDRIPMKRVAEPEDVAKVILFLASDDAGFVTGVNLPVDGGLSASNGQPDMTS
ncbi:SDR family NAD(P)-dependent oxidoreductase [uncultured Sphingomonas sp.]|uniref:SDR family NAD(P)-dependent oxidoreductase n=1 Tax=uncultured Sphingomonas sp. TaxID=158754 RepID=UPI0035C9CF00